MVINYNLDIDKFLTKTDFIRCINYDLVWPWSITHFNIATQCFGCGNILSGTQDIPSHFTSVMDTEELIMFLSSHSFGANIVNMLHIITILQMNVNFVINFY